MNEANTVRILQEVSRFLRSLSEAEVEQLLSGDAHLSLDTRRPKRGRVSPRPASAPEAELIVEELRGFATREAGRDRLDALSPTRVQLQEIAAVIDLPVAKSDTVDKLKDRIVEATIGFRLRSAAIRGVER